MRHKNIYLCACIEADGGGGVGSVPIDDPASFQNRKQTLHRTKQITGGARQPTKKKLKTKRKEKRQKQIRQTPILLSLCVPKATLISIIIQSPSRQDPVRYTRTTTLRPSPHLSAWPALPSVPAGTTSHTPTGTRGY